MALTKEIITDKIEIVGIYKSVQCRDATIIREDDVEISRSIHRHVLNSSSCVKNEDGTFTHTDTDISGEPADTRAVCAAVWTNAVKDAWKTFCEENTP
jgi:hypothetical protein